MVAMECYCLDIECLPKVLGGDFVRLLDYPIYESTAEYTDQNNDLVEVVTEGVTWRVIFLSLDPPPSCYFLGAMSQDFLSHAPMRFVVLSS